MSRDDVAEPAELLVCPLCGGTEIEHLAWVDPNTNVFLDHVMNGEERWCRTCEEHPTEFIKKSEYRSRKA